MDLRINRYTQDKLEMKIENLSSEVDKIHSSFNFFQENLSFEWEVGNISDLQLNRPKLSPPFDLIDDYYWYLELERTSRCCILLNLCNIKNVRIGIGFTVTVAENRGKAFYSHSETIDYYDSVKKINLLPNFKLPVSLRNDLLLITCSMKIHNAMKRKRSMFATNTKVCQPFFCSCDKPSLKKLSRDLKHIYDENINTDISFQVGDAVIKAHRTILCARSPVFTKILDHSISNNVTSLKVIDIKESTMRKFLNYLYSGVYENSDFQDTCDLYYAANKYEVLDLRNACKSNLMSHLKVDTACSLLILANRHEDTQFVKDITRFISENFKDIVATKHWDNLIEHHTKLAGILMRHCTRAM